MRALGVVILVIGFILGGWAPAASAADAAERTGRISADRLNLRGSPSTTAEVVSTMVRDDMVTILEEQGEWYRLRLADGRTGWAAAKYIQLTADTPAAETAPDGGKSPDRDDDTADVAPPPREGGHGGGSFLGRVLKWGCLLGAGACGYLAYDEHSQGNTAYDDYKAEYNRLVLTGQAPVRALAGAEPLRVSAEDHDKKSQTFAIAAGALGAAFLVQELFLGGNDDEEASVRPARSAEAPLLACGFGSGQFRAAVTLARF